MRTIDPFLAPGLWGGCLKPSPSAMMTAGRFSSPPRRSAVIARPFLTEAPLAALSKSVLGPRFHAWYGRSKRRIICSLYPVLHDEVGAGLPDFSEAIVIAAVRDEEGLHACALFAFEAQEDRCACVAEAIAAGATEWHVHLLAQDRMQRSAVMRDLGG